LINWQWGLAYWGCEWWQGGCDATPYFRVFNPSIQLKKFDEKGVYIRQWIPEFELGYGKPMVDHAFARERAIATYKRHSKVIY
jgi:deoxyribodipyrimidine photo-lyase